MSEAAPVISVCIANYNGMGLIDECIASVIGQTGDIPIEIIVHDDASGDDSVDHVRRFFPDVHLIESESNVGFCVANNRMAAVARGDYLLLLNNDATLLPNALEALSGAARRLAGPAILTLPQYDAESGELLDMGCRLDPFLNPVPNRDPDRADVGMVHGACLWIDKSLWDELGGFPEWFGSVGEDLFLCCRARLAGYAVQAVGTSGYHHRVGRSFGGGKVQEGRLRSTFRRRALSERNKTFVMAMTYPPPYVQLLLPIHLLLLLAEGLALSILKRSSGYLGQIYLPVWREIYRCRSLLMSGRRTALRERRLASADFFAVFEHSPYKWRMLLRHGLPHLS